VMQMFRSTLRIRTYKEIVRKQTTLQIEERNALAAVVSTT